MFSCVLAVFMICTVFVQCQNQTTGDYICDIEKEGDKLNEIFKACEPQQLYCKQSETRIFIAGKMDHHCFYEMEDLVEKEGISCESQPIAGHLLYFECRGDAYTFAILQVVFKAMITSFIFAVMLRLAMLMYNAHRVGRDRRIYDISTKVQSAQQRQGSRNILDSQTNAPKFLLSI